ncbi:MAG: 50S ribosomal protein L22 [Dehalococcoidia bacterium]|nr:MAG: 50S ribosomal protein L22 [Dehalococcoidia bacterium]
MEVVASARQVRVSPRKVRLVLDTVRGKKVDEALTILSFLPTPAARTVAKVVRSAAANAENNYQMTPAQLRIVKTFANEGQILRRYRAGARGRVNPFCRRFSHITVIVEEE